MTAARRRNCCCWSHARIKKRRENFPALKMYGKSVFSYGFFGFPRGPCSHVTFLTCGFCALEGFPPSPAIRRGIGINKKTIPTDGKGKSKEKAAVIWADNFTTLVKNWEIWIAFRPIDIGRVWRFKGGSGVRCTSSRSALSLFPREFWRSEQPYVYDLFQVLAKPKEGFNFESAYLLWKTGPIRCHFL